MKNKLNHLIEQSKEELVALTMDLISMDTVQSDATSKHPFGENMTEALDTLLEYAKAEGLGSVEVYDNKFAIIDLYSNHPEAKLFMVMNHLDVVEIGEQWTKNPYGEIIDSVIYGRGATDNKGPLAASLLAFILINQLDLELKNHLRLFIGLDEENDFRSINHYKALDLEEPDFGITPDAKFPLVDREYGILSKKFKKELVRTESIQIETSNPANVIPNQVTIKEEETHFIEGVSAHSAEPADGVNAIHKMIRENSLEFENQLLNDLFTRVKKELTGDHLLGEIAGHPIEYSITQMNLKDDAFTFTLDARFDERIDVQELEHYLSEKYYFENFDIESSRLENGYYLDDSEFKSLLLNTYESFRPNDDLEPLTLKGTTYGKAFENIVPYGISFKDSPKSYAHGPDERVHISKLFEGFRILTQLIYGMATKEFKENRE